MDIIATLGCSCTGSQLDSTIEKCLKEGVEFFRFNRSKYDNKNILYERALEILRIKNRYKTVKVMLDIPFPYQKPRIFINNNDKQLFLKKHDVIHIYSNHESEIYIDALDFKLIKPNDSFIYSDGNAIFRIKTVFSDYFIAQIENDCLIQSTKSLTLGTLIRNQNLNHYIEIIKMIRPNSVALSFVEHVNDVLVIKEEINFDVEFISKIESDQGLNGISSIAEISSLMVARGDLVLNSNFLELCLNQDLIIQQARTHKQNYYIATGILDTLNHRSIPSPAEICDLYNIISKNPTGIILNYDAVKTNISKAAQIINEMCKDLKCEN